MRRASARGVVSRGLTWCFLFLTGIILPAQENITGTSNNPSQAADTCLRRGIALTVWKSPENASLRASDLQITVDGKSAPVLSLNKENLSPRIVLLVDTSGSMGGISQRWKNSLLAVGFALDSLPPHSPVALVTFSNKTDVWGFGDPEQIRQKLLALTQSKPHGATALYDAIHAASRLFGTPQFGDTIYIVTDGGDNHSAASLKLLVNTLIQHGIRIFAFVVRPAPGDPAPPSPEVQAGVDFIEFVKSTGGGWIEAQLTPTWSQSKKAQQDRESIRSQIESPYALEVQLPFAPAKPTKLKIASSARGFEISYPQHIEPCPPSDALAKR
jgi:hypothetical protein